MDLSQSLKLVRKDFDNSVSAETLEAIDSVTKEVISLGIAGKNLQVGDTIPDFVLPNYNGQLIEIKEL